MRIGIVLLLVFGMGSITAADGWKIGPVGNPQLAEMGKRLRDATSGSTLNQMGSISATKALLAASAVGGNPGQESSSFRQGQGSRLTSLAVRESILDRGKTSGLATRPRQESSDIDLTELVQQTTRSSATAKRSSTASGSHHSLPVSQIGSEITIDNAERVRVRQPAASGCSGNGYVRPGRLGWRLRAWRQARARAILGRW